MKFEEIIRFIATLTTLFSKANGLHISMTSFIDGEINVLCCDKQGEKVYELLKNSDGEWTEKSYKDYQMKIFNGGI